MLSVNRWCYFVVVISIFVAGCATVNENARKSDKDLWVMQKLPNEKYAIYYYALVQSTGTSLASVVDNNPIPKYKVNKGNLYVLASTTPYIADMSAGAIKPAQSDNSIMYNANRYNNVSQPNINVPKYQPPAQPRINLPLYKR